MKGPTVYLPAEQVPSFRIMQSFKNQTNRKFLFVTRGGLGDQVCAEPVMRWALKNIKGVEFYLETPYPEIFSHLDFLKVYSPGEVNKESFLVFETIRDSSNLLWEFFSHSITHCVDFISLCMFRCQIPNKDKAIEISFNPKKIFFDVKSFLNKSERFVFIHPGKHWPSKTFPKKWYSDFTKELVDRKLTPVFIGKKVDENVGYVDFDFSKEDCVDLRDKLNISELIYLLQSCKAVFTNDSSPLHIAASGKAFIGFVATCKHPDYLIHWRDGVFGKDMKNFGRDGLWNYMDFSPAKEHDVTIEEMSPEIMERILPDPAEVAEFYKNLLIKN